MTEHTTCPDCKATGQLDQFCRFCQQHFGPNTNRPYPRTNPMTANPQTALEAAQQLAAETDFLLRLLDSKQPDGMTSPGLDGQVAVVRALIDCLRRRLTGKLVDDLALTKRPDYATKELQRQFAERELRRGKAEYDMLFGPGDNTHCPGA